MAVTTLAFHLTDRCQLNCDHCLRDPGKKPQDLSFALIERLIGEAKRVYNTPEVAMTGGEPTLHPDFFRILDVIVEHEMTWRIVTNAEKFDRLIAGIQEKPERFAALRLLNISLDGADEKTHDGIRGSGSFRKVVGAVTQAKFLNIDVNLQMTLNKRNVHQIEEFALLASHIGAASVKFEMTQPSGTFLDSTLFISARELKRARDRIQLMNEALRIQVNYTSGFPQDTPFHMCDTFQNDVLYVDPFGNLSLCCRHAGIPEEAQTRDYIGNLNEMSLVQAHRKMMDVVDIALRERLSAMEAGTLSGWDESPCNFCLKCFGKPHWTETGAAGATASRDRWVGKWSPTEEKKLEASRLAEKIRDGAES